MNIIEIIEKKKNEEELSKEEIKFFVDGYNKGEIEDYQAAALIMAICINGLTIEEIVYLTESMVDSGEILDLSDISKNTVDNFSMGGVGNKITLILLPIVASLGVPIAKMSIKDLGISGRTLDKLEAIPGYKTELNIDEFKNNVKEHKISLIAQSINLAPADKKIYSLRDKIGCTNSIPLIAASIMSKKIASGANNIILDVTCGKGAFMKTKQDAKILSKLMKHIGKKFGKNVMYILTDMNEPLGYSVGNSLEVIEAVNALKGEMPEDIKEIVLIYGAYMLKMAGEGEDLSKNKEKILEVIKNGKAYDKFVELVAAQEGDISYIEDLSKFEKAPFIVPVLADEEGYVESLNAKEIGKVSITLGAGRTQKDDAIDSRVGIVLCKKKGDLVKKDDILAYVHSADENKLDDAIENVKKAYTITKKHVKKTSCILEVL